MATFWMHGSSKEVWIMFYEFFLFGSKRGVDINYSLNVWLSLDLHINHIHPAQAKGAQKWNTSNSCNPVSGTRLFSMCRLTIIYMKEIGHIQSLLSKHSYSTWIPYGHAFCILHTPCLTVMEYRHPQSCRYELAWILLISLLNVVQVGKFTSHVFINISY